MNAIGGDPCLGRDDDSRCLASHEKSSTVQSAPIFAEMTSRRGMGAMAGTPNRFARSGNWRPGPDRADRGPKQSRNAVENAGGAFPTSKA